MGFDDLEKYGKTSENSARMENASYFKKKHDQAIYTVLRTSSQNLVDMYPGLTNERFKTLVASELRTRGLSVRGAWIGYGENSTTEVQ